MKIVIKIVAVLAAIMGIMAAITGTRVLIGVFDPGYQFFTALIIYNVIMGITSVVAGWFIWRQQNVALFFAYIITGAHILVFILLKTLYTDIISMHSVNAMTFRSVAWVIFTLIIWKGNFVFKKNDEIS